MMPNQRHAQSDPSFALNNVTIIMKIDTKSGFIIKERLKQDLTWTLSAKERGVEEGVISDHCQVH